jgi:hypothetical protein
VQEEGLLRVDQALSPAELGIENNMVAVIEVEEE